MTDSDLQLNIFVRESEQYRGQKVKITGKTWKQRVKSRKLLKQKSKLQEKDTTKDQGRIYNPHNEQKHEKEKKEKEVNDTGQRESKKQNEIKEDKSDKSDDKQKDIRKRKLDSSIPGADPDFGTKKMKPGQIISSLFTFNPQIPQVESVVPVAQIKEDLFSSKTFRELGLHPHLASTLEEKMKITQMTSVQQKAIPHVMMGTDTLVQSQTGSGKTMVFAVPIVQALQALTPKVSRIDGPYALVVVPTRELALQCYQTFEQLLNPFLWIVPGCIVGGVKRKAEKARLRKGINILVCTPGRLIDHIRSTGCLSLKRIRWLIIDEADRLLDMGYEKDVAQIINSLNMAKPVQGSEVKQRQTVLLSATLTQGVQRMAGISVTDPVRVDLSQTDQVTTETIPTEKSEESWNKAADQGTFSVPDNLRQHFIITPCKLRLVTLAAFIIQKCRVKQKPGKMVVFLPTQGAVEFHHCVFNHFFGGGDSESDMLSDLDVDLGQKNMAEDDLQFFKLHGEMPQSDRVNVYHNFSKAKSGILLCTKIGIYNMKSVMEVRAVAIVLVVLSITSAVHGAFNPILTVDSCTKSKLVLNVTEASSSGIIYIQGQTSVCKQDTYNGSHIHEFDFASCGISWANSFKVIVQKKSLYQTGDDKQIPIMCVADLSDLTVANGINALDKDDDAGQNLTVKPTALMKLFKNGVDVSGGNVQLTDILTMSIELDSEFLDDFDIMAMSCYASTINIINTDCAVDTELFPNFQKPITGIISAAFGAFRTTDLMGGSVGMTFSCTLKVCLGSCPPDVACRGLDLPNVRWIVQYTAPVSTSDYVHRVGRTARAGKLGHSLLFLLPSEVEFVAHLNKGKIGLEELQMDSVLGSLLGNMADLEKGNIQREPPRTYEEAATYLQMCVEQYVHDNSRVMDRAVQGFQSFVKAYATYPSDMKSIFHVKHLHLGHVAKSFGLRESPSGIKSSGTKRQHGKHGYKEHDRLKSKKRTVISEFGSGLNESGKLAKLNKIYQKSKKHEGKK